MHIVCIVSLPLSKDSLREILVACIHVRSVIVIPTTSMSWESLSLNLTVTGSVTFFTGRTSCRGEGDLFLSFIYLLNVI
jgi:hypothetical protein